MAQVGTGWAGSGGLDDSGVSKPGGEPAAPIGGSYQPTPEYRQAELFALERIQTQCPICRHGAEPGETFSLAAGCPYATRKLYIS